MTVVGGYPPCLGMGGGIILHRLLEGLEPGLVVVCSGAVHETATAGRRTDLLECEHRLVRPWAAPRLLRRLVRLVNFLRTPAIALRLRREVSGRAVLLVPWSGNLGAELFIAGWLAAAAAGSRLVVYELDDWDASLDDHQAWLARTIGHAVHGRILRRADTVLAISPPLAESLHERCGVEVGVLASALEPPPPASTAPTVGTRPTIVFIGAVYGAQADSIARVLRCLERRPDPVDLVLFTSSSAEELATLSIAGPSLRLKDPVGSHEVLGVLRQASALLLPLSFLPEQRHTVSTSLPTKTADYLWSGVPVLVHGPPESVVARLARAEGWGVVADSDDEQALATAVSAILGDSELRARVSARARETAAVRHDLGQARRRIQNVLGVESGADGIGAD